VGSNPAADVCLATSMACSTYLAGVALASGSELGDDYTLSRSNLGQVVNTCCVLGQLRLSSLLG
jgi:hypothetical protein